MRLHPGVVQGIDRTNQVLRFQLSEQLGTDTEVEASYDWRNMPWPLCEARFCEVGGRWHCVGPVGHRRELFRDDFTQVTSPNGDTPWNLGTSGGGATFAALAGVGLGVGRLTVATNPSGGYIAKDEDAFVIPEAPSALHLLSRFALTGAPTGGLEELELWVGFSTILIGSLLDTSVLLRMRWDAPLAGGEFGVWSIYGASKAETAVEGTVYTSGAYVVGELVVWSESAAAWLDGNGPAELSGSGNVPSGAVTPLINCANETTPAVTVDIDYVTLSRVTIAV